MYIYPLLAIRDLLLEAKGRLFQPIHAWKTDFKTNMTLVV